MLVIFCNLEGNVEPLQFIWWRYYLIPMSFDTVNCHCQLQFDTAYVSKTGYCATERGICKLRYSCYNDEDIVVKCYLDAKSDQSCLPLSIWTFFQNLIQGCNKISSTVILKEFKLILSHCSISKYCFFCTFSVAVFSFSSWDWTKL